MNRSFSRQEKTPVYKRPLVIILGIVGLIVFIYFIKKVILPSSSSPSSLSSGFDISNGAVVTPERVDPVLYQEPLSWRPRLFKIKKFLSSEECDLLIQMSRNKLSPVAPYDPKKGLSSIASRSVHAGKMAFMKPDATAWLDQRISRLVHMPVEYGEEVIIRKLEKGDRELSHVDYYPIGESPEVDKSIVQFGNRYATLIMFLNDDYSGGEYKFKTRLPAPIGKMIKGDALLYYNTNTKAIPDPETEHEVSPITSGDKWVAVKWIRQKKWRISEDEKRRFEEELKSA